MYRIAWILLLLAPPAFAGSITFQVAEGGQPTLTKTYSLLDSEIDRLVAALQQAANTSINGTATRAQVLNYWVQNFMDSNVVTVKSFEKEQAVKAVPDPTPIAPK